MLVWKQRFEESESKFEWKDIGDFIHNNLSEIGNLSLLAVKHTKDSIQFRINLQKFLKVLLGQFHELCFEILYDKGILKDAANVEQDLFGDNFLEFLFDQAKEICNGIFGDSTGEVEIDLCLSNLDGVELVTEYE